MQLARYWLTDDNQKKVYDAARKRAKEAEKQIKKEHKAEQKIAKSKGKAVTGKRKSEGKASQEIKRQRATESQLLSANRSSQISTQDSEDEDEQKDAKSNGKDVNGKQTAKSKPVKRVNANESPNLKYHRPIKVLRFPHMTVSTRTKRKMDFTSGLMIRAS